jgi:hypothetical protein
MVLRRGTMHACPCEPSRAVFAGGAGSFVGAQHRGSDARGRRWNFPRLRGSSTDRVPSTGEPMNKRTVGFLVIVGLAAAAALGLSAYNDVRARWIEARSKVDELQAVVTSTRDFVVGHTKYTDYLSAGRSALSSQSRFLAATVTRDERHLQAIERSWLGLKVKGAVVATYAAEYNFGFDMGPNDYDVKLERNEIVVTLNRPVLIGTPAVRNLHHEILADGWFVDGKEAALKLYEGASQRAQEQGRSMASDPAIVALCEKNLAAFLRDFLAKQPGVAYVPAVRVAYRPAKTSPG